MISKQEYYNNKINLIRKLLAQKLVKSEVAQDILGLDNNNFNLLFSEQKGFLFIKTSLKDAWLIRPLVFKDSRGFFTESYRSESFKAVGIDADFVQDNHSFSKEKGVLRGLHWQVPPMAQAKLLRVVKGSVYDVIVDIREKSPTFGHWEGFHLSADNALMLFVPRGFAHGFCTLEPNTEVIYKADNYYSPEHEGGVIYNDRTLDINWPLKDPILSDKDRKLPAYQNINTPFSYG